MTDEYQNSFKKRQEAEFSENLELQAPFVPLTIKKKLIWIPLIALFLLVSGWFFFGSIPFLINGFGIVINKEGIISVQTKTDGIVSSIPVSLTQKIGEGDVLVELVNPQNNLKYKNRKDEVDKLTLEVEELKKQIQKEDIANRAALMAQKISANNSLKELEGSIQSLEKEVERKRTLYKEGLLGIQDLESAQSLLSQRKIAYEKTKVSLVQIDSNLQKGWRQEELEKKEMSLANGVLELELLSLANRSTRILSPLSGKIIEILTSVGEHVDPGKTLIKIEPLTRTQSFVAYIPIRFGKMIQINSSVEMEPTNIDSKKYGSIYGIVKEISDYPVSAGSINTLIQNEGLALYLTQNNEAMTMITIEPLEDLNSPSGYKWSSSSGPPYPLTNGTVFLVKGISGRSSPFYYFFNLN